MRVLLTGASGFIGAYVALYLARQGVEVWGFSRSAPPPWARVSRWLAGDVTDREAVQDAVRGCTAVVHSAALYSYARRDGPAMRAVNVTGTRNVCEAALRCDVPRVVITSSSATCGPVPGRAATEDDRPPAWELTVPYKRTKLDAERLAMSFVPQGLEVVAVNPTTVVGPQDARPTPSGKMVRDVVEGAITGFVVGAGINVVGVRDIAAGHVLALAHGRAGERYILGGENLHMDEAFGVVAAAVGRRRPRLALPWSVPYALAWGSDRASRAIGREPKLLVLDEVKLARHPLFFSSEKAIRELGYVPGPAADALAEAARWFAGTRRAAPRARPRFSIRPVT